MTDDASPSTNDRSIEVVRDVTFTRFCADEAVMAVLGRDLEVAFLQYGPVFTRQVDRGDQEETLSRNVVTEVARMRMDYPSFLRTVMEFLEEGIATRRIKPDAVQQSIAEWAGRLIPAENDKPGNEK